ncbi:MAG: hypothetical protein ACTHN5_15865 [Phycisphaerae bacterium]
MRFYTLGTLSPQATDALKKHEQATHGAEELQTESTSPAELLPALQKRQWELLTTDAGFIHALYEQKVAFSGVIVLLLEAEDGEQQAAAVDRLFERYRRLTPRRLYTVTPSRVKVRQLPGAGQV